MRIPKVVERLIESFEKLPGIGPKTAQRLTFYLLHVPQIELDSFAQNLTDLKKNTVLCSVCRNVAESDPCHICSDPTRDKGTIFVVEQPLDVLSIERTGKFSGIYHVLHGAINPLDNIGPEELYINDLVRRVGEGGVGEVILATNPTMEGEATAMFISKQLRAIVTSDGGSPELVEGHDSSEVKFKITRLGMGIPTGADIEYADETTLMQAIEGRRNY